MASRIPNSEISRIFMSISSILEQMSNQNQTKYKKTRLWLVQITELGINETVLQLSRIRNTGWRKNQGQLFRTLKYLCTIFSQMVLFPSLELITSTEIIRGITAVEKKLKKVDSTAKLN